MTAQVVINDVLPKTQSIATSGQTVFDTNWTANVESDVLVYARADGVAADDATQLISSSNYNVTFVGSSRLVRVTFLSGRTLNDIVTIIRDTPDTRENLYTNTNLTPSMLNQDFGIRTLIEQQNDLYNRMVAPRYNVSEILEEFDFVLPKLAANETWVMNSDGDEIIVYELPSSGIAPAEATYIVQTPDAALPNAFALSTLTQGFLAVSADGVLASRGLIGTTRQIDILHHLGGTGDPTFSIANNVILPGTAGMGIPQGTTGQRVVPTSGINFRFNTTLQSLEFYYGGTWVQVEDSTDISDLIARLAAHTAGDGASMIGLENQGSVSSKFVQDLAEATILAQTDNGTLVNGVFLSAQSTGMLGVTTATGALHSRTLTGTTNQITVTNGNGNAGNPTFSLPSTLVLPGSMELGSLFFEGDTIEALGIGGSINLVAALPTGRVNITGLKLDFDMDVNDWAITSSVANGEIRIQPNGTGRLLVQCTKTGTNAIIRAENLDTTSSGQAIVAITTAATSNAPSRLIMRANSDTPSQWSFGHDPSLSNALYIGRGEYADSITTGLALTIDTSLNLNLVNALKQTSGGTENSTPLTNGQLWIGNTGNAPSRSQLTAGPGITISNSAGGITISGTGSGYTWTEVTGTSQAMSVDSGYIANNAALVTLTLPATSAIGQTVIVQGKGAGLFRIAQNAGQIIVFGASATTTGVGGYLEATHRRDSIELVCTTADTVWSVLTAPMGVFTVV